MIQRDRRKMDKPCCRDLTDFVFRAAKRSRLPIPIQVICLFVDPEEVDESYDYRGYSVVPDSSPINDC